MVWSYLPEHGGREGECHKIQEQQETIGVDDGSSKHKEQRSDNG